MKKAFFCRVLRASLLSILFLFVFPLNAENFFIENFENSNKENIKIEKVAKASKEKKPKKGKKEEIEEIDAPTTKITVDQEKKIHNSGFFAGIEDEILALVEEGSPESLLVAIGRLKKSSVDYQENEKVLVCVAAEILKTVWSSQNFSIETPQAAQRNAYIGAIESAKNGIYDTSTGNVDFLASVLPSLVFCGNSNVSNYYQQAESDLKRALELNPKSVLANYLLGLVYSKMGKNDEALAKFKTALEKSNAFEIGFNMALVLNALNRGKESQDLAERLLVIHPSDLNLLKLNAKNSYNAGDYSSAERYAMLVLTQNPSDLEMVLFRAKIFVRTGEYLKATSLLDVYAKSNSNAKEYFVLRARVQKEWNKNIDAAIATIEKALSLYPDDKELVLAASELAGESGRNVGGKSAAELSTQILKTDPDNSTALSFLIKTFMDAGQWKEAYDSSKKLMEKNPSINVVGMHVDICLALGYEDEAWSRAAAIYEKFQDEEKAVQIYVAAMIRTGKTAQASRFINSSLGDASSSMKSFLYYQRSFLASGESAQLSDLRSAVMANPRNSDALFRMYEIYFQKQDYRKAQYYLRQVIALNPNNSNYLKLNSDLDKLIK